MIIGANLRFGGSGGTSNGTRPTFTCPASSSTEAGLLFTIAVLGLITNVAVMLLILGRPALRRWSQGLIFHQAAVDCSRAVMLLPLALSHHFCQPVNQCSIIETVFLLLATVSAVNLLTTVLNDTPLMPDDDGIDMDWLVSSADASQWFRDEDDEDDDRKGSSRSGHRGRNGGIGGAGGFSATVGAKLLDAPHCVVFGIVMIWFAAITVNLGPTFITGALANHIEVTPSQPACPLIQTAYRHYIVNLLWVVVNSLCLVLTATHLYRLHRDLIRSRNQALRVTGVVSTAVGPTVAGSSGDDATYNKLLRRLELEGLQRIRMFTTICMIYAVFWGPLFLTVAFGARASEEGRGLASVGPPKDPASHQVTLYICFAHAFVNPTVFLFLHSGLREEASKILACCFGRGWCDQSDDDSGGSPRESAAALAGFGRQRPAALSSSFGLDYGRILNFNGAPSFLSPLSPMAPPFPPLPPLPAVSATVEAASADSTRHMETVI